MHWLDRIFGWFSFGSPDDSASGSVTGWQDDACTINPASGLPMVGGCGGLDVAGNPYGMNQDSWSHSTSWDSPSSDSSSWGSGIGSSWDD